MRKPRRTASLPQRPWGQIPRPYEPIRVLSDDHVQAIHQAALTVLRDLGMRVLHPTAREAFRAAGARIDGDMVFLDPDMVEATRATAPETFTLAARNRARDLQVGGAHTIFTSVGGPAYVMDIDRGRRDGTHQDMCDFLRLCQSLNVIQQESGGPLEPMDLPPRTRHLDLYHAQITLLDKSWELNALGRGRTMDGLELAAKMMGWSLDRLVETPVMMGVINTNSPRQLDIPMAEGLMTLAEYGQCAVVTPFTLAGAMAPVTLAGALTLQHAEALLGIVLTQLVRKGAPVVYGGFTSNVDMKSGAPAFGTPEYAKAAQASGQLARHLRLPFRSSNVTAANALDAQAAYESQMSIWGALMGGANLLMHGAGWMHGGLTASYEKLILDAEMLGMMQAYFSPIAVDEASIALEAIAEAGAGGHFFGTAHTMARFETAFHAPMLSTWDNYPSWLAKGAEEAPARANRIWKDLLAGYEPPPLDPGIRDDVEDYIARRKAEGGVEVN
ncbi:trimethylamine methyltransferase family protein [Rhodobacter sp. KR11]|uniref:trimethylamine methyltransferase family protein n=1 Tax=Rhodobacter sp. KR11 TaxID=2974588 RepID=UPI0022222F46|nr:trimethylamine methyltransferase family protein [Rhodobacter sp. KR11]MCW1917318.1 trimethylamine methyltransferase family protein [Rhodobacter sp. KR11]